MSDSDNIKVFISYTHDSDEHKNRVLRLANRLVSNGIDCTIDQYEAAPQEGWGRWTSDQIQQANFVLIVCTEIFKQRFEGSAELGKGAGAKWESAIITQQLYEAEGRSSKYIPVIFSEDDLKHIPLELRSRTRHVIDGEDGYLDLYRHITNQPRAKKGDLGERLILPPVEMVTNVDTSETPIAETSNLSPPPNETSTLPPYESQILKVLSSLRSVLEESETGDLTLRTDKLDSFEIVRHHLFSIALMSQHVPSSMLGVHETHLLYLSREQLQPLRAELSLLFRMLLNDHSGLIPGWYWFSWLEQEGLRDTLYEFALRDRNASVRANAWELLATARILPVEDSARWGVYSKTMVTDESAFVRRAALSYLGAIGCKSDIPTIKSRLDDDDASVRKEASIARLLVLARTSPDQVLTEEIPTFLIEKMRVLSELKANADKIHKEALLKAIHEHKDNYVRLLVLDALRRKGEITSEHASSLLENASGKVAEVLYRRLIEQGEKFSSDDIYLKVGDETYNREHSRSFFLRESNYADSNAVLVEMYGGYTEKELWELVDWESEYGAVAYKALALHHFTEAGSRIRNDLNEDFKSYKGRYLEKAIPRWVERSKNSVSSFRSSRSSGLFGLAFQQDKKEEQTPEESANQEAERVKSKYIAAALAGIAQHGEAHDVQFGRHYLSRDDYSVRVEAVEVIKKFGDEDDIQALIDLAKTKEGVLQESAARVALDLSSDFKETARSLLSGANEDLARVVVSYLTNEQDEAATAKFLEPLLLEKNDVVRRKVMAFFIKKFKEGELESLLGRYTDQQTYYYDVVCWLDKVLYAPAKLKETFVRQLEEELTTDDSDV